MYRALHDSPHSQHDFYEFVSYCLIFYSSVKLVSFLLHVSMKHTPALRILCLPFLAWNVIHILLISSYQRDLSMILLYKTELSPQPLALFKLFALFFLFSTFHHCHIVCGVLVCACVFIYLLLIF